jgi:hypothetical protein
VSILAIKGDLATLIKAGYSFVVVGKCFNSTTGFEHMSKSMTLLHILAIFIALLLMVNAFLGETGRIPGLITGLILGGLTLWHVRQTHNTPQIDLAKAPPQIEETAASVKSVLPPPESGLYGTVTNPNGDAFYGNSTAYTPDLYYGRLSHQAQILLLDEHVYQNQFDRPIIKVKALSNEWDSEIGKIGWIGLTETSFSDAYQPATQTIKVVTSPNPTPAAKAVPEPIEDDTPGLIKTLRRHSLAYQVSYAKMVDFGAEGITELHAIALDDSDTLHPVAQQLIRDIGQATLDAFDKQLDWLVCPRCFTYFTRHRLQLGPGESVRYCGCRICHQSQKQLQATKGIVVRLNQQTEKPYYMANGELVVNWPAVQTLFDFDTIEIRRADDELVERFAMLVSNDTDPRRQPRYKKMACTIWKRCKLSANTMRVLESVFGQVKVR